MLIESSQDRFEQNAVSAEMIVVVMTLTGLQVRQVAEQAIERSNLIATH